jgi:hypothetical protein
VKITIVCLLFFSYILQSHAEDSCKFVLDTQLTSLKVFGEPTDVQELVLQVDQETSCRTFYRIYLGDEWRSASGFATGRTREDACAKALSLGNGRLLSEIAPDTIKSTTETLCTDFEDIRLRPVQIGDRIWESNVDVSSKIKERPYFSYKGARCRKFSERIPVPQGLYLAQGVICRTGSTPNARWLVVDKY